MPGKERMHSNWKKSLRARAFERAWVIALAALLVFTEAAGAQTPGTASVRGQVVDETGAAVTGADVRVESPSTGVSRAAQTDAAGRFTIAELPLAGAYTLRVHKNGFADQQNGPFGLRAGESAGFQVRLAPAAVSAEVRVSGTTEGVRADSPSLGTRFDTKAIENTPLLGRKLTNLPLLNSAVRSARGTGDLFLNNTLFVIDGGGRRQTTFTIDGSTGDDEWGRQTIFTNVPLAAVQEFTVLTNSFSAEYGRTTGAAINLITRAGTNDFHGDVLAAYRPTSLEAKAPVTGVEAGDELRQGSLFLSGPLVANRVFFSAGGEYSAQDRDSVITSPLAPGVYTGHYRQTLGFLRLDGDVNSAHHATARFNYDSFKDANPQDVVGGISLPSAGRVFRRRTEAVQVSETAVLS
jgi:type 1 fimbria pilin